MITKKTVDEWAKLLLPAAGWKDTGKALGDRKRRVNANDFGMLYKDRMELGPSYTLPATPIPTVCDECKQPCTSECICGELFCSRTCLRASPNVRAGGGEQQVRADDDADRDE
jgi:hypothetical protein